MIKSGDIVFFRQAKKSIRGKSPTMQAKGNWFGIVLGHVNPFQKEPTQEIIPHLIGSVGFISFDDVIEFLGKEACDTALAKFNAKYYPEVPEKKDTCQPAAPSNIIGLDGKPLGDSHAP